MVRMLLEQPLNLLAAVLQLAFQAAQEFDQRQGQPAFGPDDGRAAAKLMSLSKKLQSLLGRLGPIEPMNVQKVFPSTLAGFAQQLRRGESLDELPAGWSGPVVKGLECRRIIIGQGGLQLVD